MDTVAAPKSAKVWEWKNVQIKHNRGKIFILNKHEGQKDWSRKVVRPSNTTLVLLSYQPDIV